MDNQLKTVLILQLGQPGDTALDRVHWCRAAGILEVGQIFGHSDFARWLKRRGKRQLDWVDYLYTFTVDEVAEFLESNREPE